MVDFEQLQASVEYQCQTDLNLYDSPKCDRLATQAASGRQLRVLALPENWATSVRVCLCEDDYPGWLSLSNPKVSKTTSSNWEIILELSCPSLRIKRVLSRTRI